MIHFHQPKGEIIYVDDKLIPCNSTKKGARKAKWMPEFQLYVVDHPMPQVTEYPTVK